jgi:DNA-binding NarL/FixJ family response regulator
MPAESRIAITEHSDLVRNGLEQILSRYPGFEVVLSVGEPEGLTGAEGGSAAGTGFDVIVFGPSRQSDEKLFETIGTLSGFGRVLVMSEFSGLHRLTAAIRAGAYGCVTKHVDEDELLWAVQTVSRGALHVSPDLALRLHAELREPQEPQPAALAPRESETLGWLAVGLTHRQIASHMGLTEATVSTYVKRIRDKLHVGNKADLTRVAIDLGLLDRAGERIPTQYDASARGGDAPFAIGFSTGRSTGAGSPEPLTPGSRR